MSAQTYPIGSVALAALKVHEHVYMHSSHKVFPTNTFTMGTAAAAAETATYPLGEELVNLDVGPAPSETVVVHSYEDFMTWPPRSVDPWHRLSALEHDCVMLVEFSELEGPKPVLVVPASPGVHFDPNDFSLWLMTADYQLTSSGPFSLSRDIEIMLHNEEQGIDTYVYHFTLFDIEARGFVRPFCAAYLTRQLDYIPRIFQDLRKEFRPLVECLKSCNKRQFMKEVSQALDTLKSVETQAVTSYYELYYDNAQRLNNAPSASVDPTKAERLNIKTRRLSRDLEMAYRQLTCDDSASPICSGEHSLDIDSWITNAIHGSNCIGEHHLKSLNVLCPCAFEDFSKRIWQRIWQKFRAHNSVFRFLSEDSCGTAEVRLDGFPLMSIPTERGSNGAALSGMRNHKKLSSEQEENNGDKAANQLFVSMLPSLPQVLFPLLSGQFVLIAGGELRKQAVVQLIHKCRSFIPSFFESSSRLCMKWHSGRVPATAFAEYKLFGLYVAKNTQLGQLVASNVLPFLSVLDMNSDVFRSGRFRGRILSRINHKSSVLFPNDRVLIPYMYSVVGEYALLAYVLFYLVYSNHEVFRRNARFMSTFSDVFALGPGDLKIVRYLVEVLTQQQTDSPRFEGAFESLFLEYQPSTDFKF